MDYITSVLHHQSPNKEKKQQYTTIESIVEAKVIRKRNDDDDDDDDDNDYDYDYHDGTLESNEIHNISVSLADQSIENLRIMKATGEITRSEGNYYHHYRHHHHHHFHHNNNNHYHLKEARRLKLLKSYLEYQRECDIEEEVDRSSRHPFLLLNGCFGWISFFCRCYKLEPTSIRDIDMD